jgi:hypothetical protein
MDFALQVASSAPKTNIVYKQSTYDIHAHIALKQLNDVLPIRVNRE